MIEGGGMVFVQAEYMKGTALIFTSFLLINDLCIFNCLLRSREKCSDWMVKSEEYVMGAGWMMQYQA